MSEEVKNKSEYLVEVRDLKQYFPIKTGFMKTTPLKAVDGVSFSIKPGETLGLVGESGCGKSTVGRQLVGLETPTGGRLFYQGKDMEKLSGKEKKSVRTQLQMVFQDPYSSLNPRKHIYEILSQPMLYHGISNKETVHRDVDRLLDMVGLSKHVLGRYPHEFSGGQRQRIGIARALSLNPRFLVCDEPVSALDSYLREEVEGEVGSLLAGFGGTALLVTHNRDEAYRLCRDMIVMDGGQVLRTGGTKEVFADPQSTTAARLTGCKNILSCTRVDAHTVRLTGWDAPLRLAAEVLHRRGHPRPRLCPLRTSCAERSAGAAELHQRESL